MALTNKSTTKKRQSRNKNYVTDEMVKSPWFWVGLVILGLIYFFFLRDSGKEKKKATIDETPTCITSIKEIAEWEFLTLQLEEFETIVRAISQDLHRDSETRHRHQES